MFRIFILSIIKGFFVVHTTMGYSVQFCCQQASMIYTIFVCTVKNTWWCALEHSETCRILFQNKFERLVHRVGFVIIIYHDKRSPERYTLRIGGFHSSGSDDSDLLVYEAVSEQLTLTQRHIFVSQKIWNLKKSTDFKLVLVYWKSESS